MGKQIDDIPLAQRRALAARLLLNGEGISEVSRKARLSLPTVSKYKELVERDGADALARLRIHGGPSRLDDASQSWLVSAIKHSPGLHGYPGPTWTISQLRELIFRRFGIQFSAFACWLPCSWLWPRIPTHLFNVRKSVIGYC